MMRIKKSSYYIPKTALPNKVFEEALDTTDEWIVKRTGIENRFTAVPEGGNRVLRHMAIKAVDSLSLGPQDKNKITAVIYASGLAEENYPSVANYVSEHLAIDVPGLRVNSACSSFVSGLKFAQSFIDEGDVLVVTSESFTSIGDYSDRSSCVLFGDGACAFLLSKDTGDYKISCTELSGFGSDLINTGILGSYPKVGISQFCFDNKLTEIQTPIYSRYGNFVQDGPEVYKTIIKDIPKLLKKKIADNDLDKNDLYFIGHQANLRMLEKVVSRIGLTKARHLYNVNRYGNTGAAGCGIVLAEEIENNKFVPGDKILLSAFGAGIVYGSTIIERL